MLTSFFSIPPLGVCATALCMACSSVGAGTGAGTAEASDGVAEPVPLTPVVAARSAEPPGEPDASGGGRPARRSPVQVLEQLVTTQALLVSLLLTPLSKDAAEQPVARVDAPPTSGARLP